MGKSIEPEIVNPILTDYIEELVAKKGNLPSSKPFEVAVKPITAYEGRMLVKATDKFDVTVYIAAINFYLNRADMQARKARGALVIYMDTEVADKLFKAAGLEVPYDEDDESMLALCGDFCRLVTANLKDRLTAAGYVSLETSEPAVYKNSISHGVDFSKDQNEKQELSFYFLKHKALVIDWTLAPIPKK